LLASCLARVSAGRPCWNGAPPTTTRALAAALDRRAHGAAVDLSLLLRRDGVLDRLRASGAEVTAPRVLTRA
jgi:hypothetical protein